MLDAVILRPPHKPGMVATLKFDETGSGTSAGPFYNIMPQRFAPLALSPPVPPLIPAAVPDAQQGTLGKALLFHDRKRVRLLYQLAHLLITNFGRKETHAG